MLSDYDKKDIADAYFEDGYEKGVQKGIEKGMEANRLETAKKMLGKKLDLQLISECTGLSLEQIQALKG